MHTYIYIYYMYVCIYILYVYILYIYIYYMYIYIMCINILCIYIYIMGMYWVYNERDLQNQLNMICLSENDASTPQSWPFESGKYGFKPSDFRQNHVHSGVLSIVNVTEHYLPSGNQT
jgi:hypothetical protein